MNEVGCLVLGLGCGAVFGCALHSLVWWLRDHRAFARWDAEGPALRTPAQDERPALYGTAYVGKRPLSWAERMAELTEEQDR
jgi:hypothetical protein